MSSAVPSCPSGPGWFFARVRTMNRRLGSRSSALPKTWSLPATSGSSPLSGTNTVPPPLTVWSTPWSKNCPNRVNIELYGGERPTSVVTFGMNKVWNFGVQSVGEPGVGGSVVSSGSTTQGTVPGLPWGRTGNPAAAMGAGFVEVWSTMRLLMVRGRVSKTLPEFCLYDDGAGGPKAGGLDSASANTGVVRRGKTSSAAPILALPGTRLLQEPSTVRSPNES